MADMGILRVWQPRHLAPASSISTFRLAAGTTTLPPVSLPVLPNLPLRKMKTAGSARLRHVFRPQSGAADQPFEIDPAYGPVTNENKCRIYFESMFKFEKGLAATYRSLRGLSGPSQDNMDMILEEDTLFCEEKEKIEQYSLEIVSNMHSIRGDLPLSNGRRLAFDLCLRAREGIKLAAKVMSYAGLRANTPGEISLDIIEQAIRMYVSSFLKIAEDTFHEKVDQISFDKTNVMLFLGALRGLASVSHILVEDALGAINNIEGSSSNYSPRHDVDAINCIFQQRMRDLEKNVIKASPIEAWKLLDSTIYDATRYARVFIGTMSELRREALAHLSCKFILFCYFFKYNFHLIRSAFMIFFAECRGASYADQNDWEPDASVEMDPSIPS